MDVIAIFPVNDKTVKDDRFIIEIFKPVAFVVKRYTDLSDITYLQATRLVLDRYGVFVFETRAEAIGKAFELAVLNNCTIFERGRKVDSTTCL